MGIETAIIGGALVGGGLSFLGSKKQSSAAESAANAQVAGGDRATQAQLEMYNQSRDDLAPWRESGERGLRDLERTTQQYKGELRGYKQMVDDPSSYKQSPDFQFRQKEGLKAMGAAFSAGGLDRGPVPKAFAEYNMGLASGGYQDAVNRQGGYLGRLESLMNRYAGNAGVGQTAATNTAQMGQQSAGNMGNIAMNQGNAIAGGQINQANATTGLYNNLSNIGSNATNQYMLNNYLQNSGGGSGGGFTPSPEAGYGYGR